MTKRKEKRKKHKQLSTKHYTQQIKIEHEPHERSKVKSGSPEGYAAPAPLSYLMYQETFNNSANTFECR
jgi:hypothetical protein